MFSGPQNPRSTFRESKLDNFQRVFFGHRFRQGLLRDLGEVSLAESYSAVRWCVVEYGFDFYTVKCMQRGLESYDAVRLGQNRTVPYPHRSKSLPIEGTIFSVIISPRVERCCSVVILILELFEVVR